MYFKAALCLYVMLQYVMDLSFIARGEVGVYNLWSL